MILLRSLLFTLLFFGWTALLSVLATPLLLAPRRHAVALVRWWAGSVLWLLRVFCGLSWRLIGAENLPASGTALIAAKHQSAFDTVVWFALLDDPAYVLKSELAALPFYGWMLRRCRHIVVDRRGGMAAMRAVGAAGAAALAAGRPVVIFPEGTRVAPGARRPYQPGVAAIYAAAGRPVVPVATDSGRFWGRRSLLKRPGTITIAILPPLPPGLERRALLETLQERIDAASDALLPPGWAVDKPVE